MWANSLFRDKRGNISAFTAIALIPALLCIGIAIDTIRLHSLTRDLQSSADSAALAGAIAYARSGEEDMKAEGKALFTQNEDPRFDIQIETLTVDISNDSVVEVAVNANVKPIFMSALGYKNLKMDVKSYATLGSRTGAELAIAIDATNSMAFGTSWNDTIKTVENILGDLKTLSGNDEFYVTLVPFQDRVNVKNSLEPSWIKGNGKKHDDDDDDWDDDDWKDDWDGCVEPREQKVGSFNWMLTTDKPSSNKFELTDEDAEFSEGTKIRCPSIPITGPTNDVDLISKKIKSLTTSGTGRYDVGLAWGWRALSPDWQGQWGEKNYPYDPNKTKSGKLKHRKKYLIYMTDGRSNAYKREAMMEESWGWNNGSQQAFEHIAEICNQIKSDDIEIYMLHIPGNPNSTPYFQGCATSPDHYIVVDEAKDVAIAFDDIRNDLLSELRIVR